MAMASGALHHPLHQSISLKYPHLSHNSRFSPSRLRFTSLRFPSTIRATSAVALEPELSTQQNQAIEVDPFACPVCYEPLIRKGPPGFNLPAIYRSGFKCKKCTKTYSSKDNYLDLTITAGMKDYTEINPVRTELFRSPLVSFLYERGWRQSFNQSGFPGPDEEFEMAQEYFKPARGGLLVDVSCGSGLFSRKFAKSGAYSKVIALDFSENMLRQCYDYIKQDDTISTTNLGLVRADVSRLPFASGSVDAVHAGAAMHCWPSPSNADRFSTVTKARIFQMKSELQTIKKGSEPVSQYLQKIKDARDHLSAAGVYFEDEDIVILALNGLSSDYNTFRCMVRGRDNVLSLKDFRSQLLAEEAAIEQTHSSSSFVSAMHVQNQVSQGKALVLDEGNSNPLSSTFKSAPTSQFSSGFNGGFNGYPNGFNSHNTGGYFHHRGSQFRGRGRGRHTFPSGQRYYPAQHNPAPPSSNPGILGSGTDITTCQICGKRGHVAADCYQRHNQTSAPTSSVQCQICWKFGHSAIQCYHRGNFSYQGRPPSNNLRAMAATFPPPPEPFWVADTGATAHMTSDFSQLQEATPYSGPDAITTAGGSGLSISSTGSSVLPIPQCSLQLHQVLHVPKLSQHLLSVYRLCKDNHCRFICDDFGFWIQDKFTGNVLLKGLCSHGLYPIPFSVSSSSHTPFQLASASHHKQSCYLGQQVQTGLWHKRFGHPSNSITSTLLTQSQIPFTTDPTTSVCTTCLEGKITKLPFPYPAVKSLHPLEIIHSDVWGPAPVMSIDGFRYYVSFVDECTRYTWIFPMINKGEVYSIFVHFHTFLVAQFSATLRVFQSDGGGEYISTNFKNYLLTKGIVHQMSCPYTPEQNGLAERKHRHIVETAITLLQTAHLPLKFWFHACATSIYLINRLPCKILQLQSPFFLLYGSSPVIHHLRIFGCACFPLLRPYNTHKLQPKTSTCIFLGYAGQYKGYICFSLHTNRIFVSRHVLFDESVFPYISVPLPAVSPSLHMPVVSPSSPSVSLTNSVLPLVSPHSASLPSSSTAMSPQPSSYLPSPALSPLPLDPDFYPERLCVVLPLSPINIHPMTTRSKNGISKKKAYSATVQSLDLSQVEPRSFKIASATIAWQSAMQEEIEALHAQGTWDLVALPPDRNLVGCKWVYRLKKHADGSIARHKARLVAKGFSQEEGIDYGETFSPVVKPTTVRLVLALAAHFHWSLRQLDVKNAFLHGILHEEVYMTQPQGFVSKAHPSDFVCRLKKSLYGLKQAPRAWNERFTSFLPSLGFQASLADSSLFVQHSSHGTLLLLLYVDDIILTGSHSSLILSVITALSHEFDLTDLGPLHHFLGLQISYLPTGLFVSQTSYVIDLLARVDLQNSKSCATPCLPHHHLLKDDGQPYSNPQQYRSIVGALQYLTFTRPDIAFSVNQACQFMHNPMVSHVVAVKRILRYLKGTLHLGLHFRPGPLHLQAYSDADWAGDPNDRRSISGSLVYFGSSPISWASKKQHTVSRSSTEAEYRALAITAAELAWIRQLLCDIHIPLLLPPLIHCDNISAISLASNPVFHSRMKHLQIDYHFVRERVIMGDLLVQHVSSCDQFADILTKGLSISLFQHHCSNLMLGSSQHVIEGACEDINDPNAAKCQKIRN